MAIDLVKPEEESEDSVTKLKLDDMEFTEDELKDMVGAGRRLKDFEESQGQTLEKMNESWGRRGKTIGELKGQLEEAQGKLQGLQEQKDDPTQNDPSKSSMDAALKNLDGVMRQLGYAPKDELKQEVIGEFQTNQQVNQLIRRTAKLEEDVNPYKDEDLPKFSQEDMLRYMDESGIKDPVDAYNIRYKNEIKEWEEKKVKSSTPGGMVTDSSSTAGTSKKPPRVEVTDDNLSKLVREELSGGVRSV